MGVEKPISLLAHSLGMRLMHILLICNCVGTTELYIAKRYLPWQPGCMLTHFFLAARRFSRISGNSPFLTDCFTKWLPEGVRMYWSGERLGEGCGGVWRSVEVCGGVWRCVEECGGVWSVA